MQGCTAKSWSYKKKKHKKIKGEKEICLERTYSWEVPKSRLKTT